MRDSSRILIVIGYTATFIFAVVIGVAYFLHFYTTTHHCSGIQKKINQLQSLLSKEGHYIVRESKQYMQNLIQEQQRQLSDYKKMDQPAILASYKQHMQKKLDQYREALAYTQEIAQHNEQQLLLTIKKRLSQQLEIAQKQKEHLALLLKEIKPLSIAQETKQARQEQLQQAINNIDKKINKILSMTKQPDQMLIQDYKNKLQEKLLIIKKRIQELEKKLKVPDDMLLPKAQKKYHTLVEELEKKITANQSFLTLPEQYIIQETKNRINREILSLKLEAKEIGCKP